MPVAGLVLLLGVDRFMNEARAVTNLIGNAVATIAIAKWEGAFDRDRAEIAYRDRAAIAAADVLPAETPPAETPPGRDRPLPAALALLRPRLRPQPIPFRGIPESHHAHRRRLRGHQADRLAHPQRLHRLLEDDRQPRRRGHRRGARRRRVVGYGFNSNGRYGQGGLIRERFRTPPPGGRSEERAQRGRDNLDPHKLWAAMMTNEKPGGHGERSVAVGTLDMAIWGRDRQDRRQALFRMLAEQKGIEADPRVFVYAAGGYYYPGKTTPSCAPRCAATSTAATPW